MRDIEEWEADEDAAAEVKEFKNVRGGMNDDFQIMKLDYNYQKPSFPFIHPYF